MLESLSHKTNGKQMYYMDGSHFVDNKQDVANYWKIINQIGPQYGYHPNNKSMVYDPQDNEDYWNKQKLNSSEHGIVALNVLIDND